MAFLISLGDPTALLGQYPAVEHPSQEAQLPFCRVVWVCSRSGKGESLSLQKPKAERGAPERSVRVCFFSTF